MWLRVRVCVRSVLWWQEVFFLSLGVGQAQMWFINCGGKRIHIIRCVHHSVILISRCRLVPSVYNKLMSCSCFVCRSTTWHPTYTAVVLELQLTLKRQQNLSARRLND